MPLWAQKGQAPLCPCCDAPVYFLLISDGISSAETSVVKSKQSKYRDLSLEIILIALIWKGLEKLGKGIDSLGRKKMTDEEIIDFQRKCIERDLKWMEERKKRYNH